MSITNAEIRPPVTVWIGVLAATESGGARGRPALTQCGDVYLPSSVHGHGNFRCLSSLRCSGEQGGGHTGTPNTQSRLTLTLPTTVYSKLYKWKKKNSKWSSLEALVITIGCFCNKLDLWKKNLSLRHLHLAVVSFPVCHKCWYMMSVRVVALRGRA